MAGEKFTLYKGGDRGLTGQWKNPDGTPKNCTGGVTTFRAKLKATDTAAVLTKSTATTGAAWVDITQGTYTISFDEADWDASMGTKAEQEYACSRTLTLSGRTTPEPFTINVVAVA